MRDEDDAFEETRVGWRGGNRCARTSSPIQQTWRADLRVVQIVARPLAGRPGALYSSRIARCYRLLHSYSSGKDSRLWSYYFSPKANPKLGNAIVATNQRLTRLHSFRIDQVLDKARVW